MSDGVVVPPAVSGAVLTVRDLRTVFPSDAGPVTTVDGVSFSLDAGETLAVVGESARARR